MTVTAAELSEKHPIIFRAIVAAENCLAELEMRERETPEYQMSRAEYKDYWREECATTDRGN